MFPQIKKKVEAFMLGEEGKVSKKDILKAGMLLSTIAFLNFNSASAGQPLGSCPGFKNIKGEHCYAHANGASHGIVSGAVQVQHQHHYNHTSHSSY